MTTTQATIGTVCKLGDIPVKIVSAVWDSPVYRQPSVIVSAIHGEPFTKYSTMSGLFYGSQTSVPVSVLEELIATVYDDCPACLTIAEQTEIDQDICTASYFDGLDDMPASEVDDLVINSTTE